MNRKYVLVEPEENRLKIKGFYRIKALIDFKNVKAGDLGGYIKNESNLSHEGNCWIYDDARVYDNAIVSEDARIIGKAVARGSTKISGHAVVGGDSDVSEFACVFDSAKVLEHAKISGYAKISGFSYISGSAKVYDYSRIKNATIKDYSQVRGSALVDGRTCLYGGSIIGLDSKVSSLNDYITIGPFWNNVDNGYITFSKNEKSDLVANTKWQSIPIDSLHDYLMSIDTSRFCNFDKITALVSIIKKWLL